MTMSDDIVARLRDLAKWEDGLTGPSDTDLIREAAAALERKDAEIAKLRTVLQEILQLVAEKAHGPIGVIARRALNPEE